jgi:hypothetical protein
MCLTSLRRIWRAALGVGIAVPWLAGACSSGVSKPAATDAAIGGVDALSDSAVIAFDAALESADGAFRSCGSAVSNGAACGAAVLPCYTAPQNPFSCAITACVCDNGKVRCEDATPGSFGGGRECLPNWFCSAEGFPVCNYDKPWYVCRCSSDGKWTCGDECMRRGCPAGPYYPGAGFARPHTGDRCSAVAECPYRVGYPGPVVTCRCVGGRFECSDEPIADGGAGDRPPG